MPEMLSNLQEWDVLISELIERALSGALSRTQAVQWAAQFRAGLHNSVDDGVAERGLTAMRLRRWTAAVTELLGASFAETDTERSVYLFEIAQALASMHGSGKSLIGGRSFIYGIWLGDLERYVEAIAVFRTWLSEVAPYVEEPDLISMVRTQMARTLCSDRRFEEASTEAASVLGEIGNDPAQSGTAVKARLVGGMAAVGIGRDMDGTLRDLRDAVKARRELDEDIAAAQFVPPLKTFLSAFADAAATAGQIGEAVSAWSEVAGIDLIEGDLRHLALAHSEIGYIYMNSADFEQARHFFRQAIDIGRRAGEAVLVRRWSLALARLEGGTLPSFDIPDVVTSVEQAYELAAQAEFSAGNNSFVSARAIAEKVVEWARHERDEQLLLPMLNIVGCACVDEGHPTKAIPYFHDAIQIANGRQRLSMTAALHHNLARAFIAMNAHEDAGCVLRSGLAWSRQGLATAESMETKQHVITRSRTLYESVAMAEARSRHYEEHVATVEMMKAQNLSEWLEIAEAIEATGKDVHEWFERFRAAETALQLRFLTRTLDAGTGSALFRTRHDAVVHLSDELGITLRTRQPMSMTGLESIKSYFPIVFPKSKAILYFLLTESDLCVTVGHRPTEDVDLEFHGAVCPDIADRLRSGIREWSGSLHLEGQRGPLSSLDLLTGIIQPLLADKLDVDLVIVPSDELALLPFWSLLDRIGFTGSFTIASSLQSHLVCSKRQRQSTGRVLVVGDVTGQLDHTSQELADLATRWPCDQAGSVGEFLALARNCSMVHVAAHGKFDRDNYLLSGIVFEDDLEPPTPLGRTGLQGGLQLLTVAQCMAYLDLSRCRLAVLSACESGLSNVHSAEEMTGLPNAFLLAGAKSVVASLWPVDDAVTRILMLYFYKEIAEMGAAPAIALARARRSLFSTTPQAARTLCPELADWPDKDLNFVDATYSDAFQCYGA